MNRRKLHYPALLLAAFLYGYFVVPHADAAVHARTPAGEVFPSGPCDFEHRMDVEILAGQWFECVCSALTMGWDCAWFQLDEPAKAPVHRNRRAALKHHRIVIRVALPGVVG